MKNILSIVESLDLSHDDLKQLSEQIEDLSRIKKIAFWKQKLYEWFTLKGEYAIFQDVYSVSTSFNNLKQTFKFKLNDDILTLIIDSKTLKPTYISMSCVNFDWWYDPRSKEISIHSSNKPPIKRVIDSDQTAIEMLQIIYPGPCYIM